MYTMIKGVIQMGTLKYKTKNKYRANGGGREREREQSKLLANFPNFCSNFDM